MNVIIIIIISISIINFLVFSFNKKIFFLKRDDFEPNLYFLSCSGGLSKKKKKRLRF